MTVHEAAREIARLREQVKEYEAAITTLLSLVEAYQKCLTLSQQIAANESNSYSSESAKTI